MAVGISTVGWSNGVNTIQSYEFSKAIGDYNTETQLLFLIICNNLVLDEGK